MLSSCSILLPRPHEFVSHGLKTIVSVPGGDENGTASAATDRAPATAVRLCDVCDLYRCSSFLSCTRLSGEFYQPPFVGRGRTQALGGRVYELNKATPRLQPGRPAPATVAARVY